MKHNALETLESNNEYFIKGFSEKNKEPEWMLNKRLEAYHFFKESQMPNFIYGLDISLNADLSLDALDIKKPKSEIKIKNANKDVIIADYKEMLKNYESVLREKFMKIAKANGKFTYFHNAFFNNLVFVYVPKNVDAKEAIEVSTTSHDAAFDHLIILTEDNAQVKLVENYESKTFNKNGDKKDDKNGYASKIVEIFAGNSSKIDYGNVQLLNENTANFTIKKAIIGKNSLINWIDCCFGSRITMSEVTTILNGDNAATNNYGIFFGNKSQQFDLVANSIHNAPHTTSDILTKGALSGSSKCVYRGLVKINQNAFGSNGYQKEDTLLLSNNAVADSIPNLEIDNNDVRCTHGASIGRIDKEKLFYMRSRGLNEKQATKEYVRGFFEPLIQKIQIKNLREKMNGMIEKRME
ncbi:Fe-S cluster assembly protein SufD [Candidatus Woesearchaeota archaeon]|nr:Fe-S cluster assembly protein SufD [Candidatus Woesearchaeota archaeon]